MSESNYNREVYLMLTEECPSRCTYCYIKNRDTKDRMTIETVDDIIEKYNPYRVIFFGGEPMLCPDIIEEIMAKYHGTRKFQIITSGIVNFDRLIEIQKKYPLDEIQISWDGNNAKSRPLVSGAYLSPLDNAKKMAKIHPVDLKCVINEDNVGRLHEIHQEFTALRELGIYGEFVIAHVPEMSEAFLSDFRRNLPLCLNVEGKTYTEFLNKILAVIRRDENFSSCDAGHYIVFRPSGEKHFCTIMSQHEYVDDDMLRRPCLSDDCRLCDINFLCDGGCRYERYANFGSEWPYRYLKQTCAINLVYYQVITEWLDSLSKCDRIKLNNTLERFVQYRNRYMGVC